MSKQASGRQYHCSALVMDYLATIASNATSSLKNEASAPRVRKDASQLGHSSAYSGMNTPAREISQEPVPDKFRRSSTTLRTHSKSMSLKGGNQGSSREVNICGRAQGSTKQKNFSELCLILPLILMSNSLLLQYT